MKKCAVAALLGLFVLGGLLAGCGTSTVTTSTAGAGNGTSTSVTSTSLSSVTSTPQSSSSTTTLSPSTATIIPGSKNVSYTVVTSGFSGSLSLTSTSVVGIVLPKSLSKGTNLSGAAVYIGASSSSSATKNWNKPLQGEISAGPVVLNGVSFAVFTRTDQAAGNIYDARFYRTLHKGVCIEVVELLHSTNIANYTAGSVKQFDKAIFQGYLASIVSSLVFK